MISLVAFGGAGPLHACSLAKLCQSYPAIIPPSPGGKLKPDSGQPAFSLYLLIFFLPASFLLVLCAFGDAMTTLRHETSRTFISDLSSISSTVFTSACSELASKASSVLEQQGIPIERQKVQFQADMRYNGQALTLPISFELEDIGGKETDKRNFGVLKKR